MALEKLGGTAQVGYTLLDVFVVDDFTLQPLGRTWLTYILHSNSKYPLGYHLSFEPPSCHTALAALKHAILPKSYVKDIYPGIENEWLSSGIPLNLILDNGHMYNKHFEDACSQLSIALEYIPRFSNTISKVDIEKLLNRIKKFVLENGALKLRNLHEAIHTWIIDDNTEQLQEFEKCIREGWIVTKSLKQLSPKQVAVLFGYTGRRKVKGDGIRVANLTYNSKELQDLYNLQSGNYDILVELKYNPEDLSNVYVYDHSITHDYIEVPCINSSYSKPLSIQSHRFINRAIGRGKRDLEETLNDYFDKSNTECKYKIPGITLNKL
ncbi:Mu transposase C-terminal domain-containing protein [Neobacillus massiliamazoniensis]|uniref:Integrase catalytic domain-containing protein n=1 Tax=Neobacillus massiliamazoniensis TaxID=1499688 RepID=A0A0U1P4D3_9BACI|nr:Mu transposase C-terminal domain-containing protein [Neobacillus massiliamazoniensis]CRK85224.1 hypothetical protein BN000_05296 [Neobacillus massiliamazoniensis]